MDIFRLRFSRWWLALSLAVKFGLGACLALALIGGPQGSAALAPVPSGQGVQPSNPVELVQARKKRRLTRAQRRAARERERIAAEQKEKAEAERREQAAREEKERAEADEREKAAREEQARLEAEQRERALREERERAEGAQQARRRKGKASAKEKDETSGRTADRVSPSAPGDASGNPLPPAGGQMATDPGSANDRASESAKSRESSNRLPSPGDQPPAPAEAEPEKQVWTDAEVIDALRECVRLLAPIAAYVDVSAPMRSGQCGAPAPVLLRRVGASAPVEISPPAVVNCRMVAKLHEWVEGTLQPAARETFNAPVRRLINASGYVCRNRNGTSIDKISEHAFANALDISTFVTADGRSIDVLSNWGKTERDLRAMALAKAEAEKAKAEADRQAKAAAAEKAQKAKGQAAEPAAEAAKSGKEPAQADEPDKSQHPAPKQPLKLREGADAKKGRGKAHEPEVVRERIPLPGKAEDGQTKRTFASNDRNAPGADPRTLRDVTIEAPVITKEGAFLRRLHKGACGIFGTVLGPEANEAHRNHFHLDLAPRRRSAYCE